MGKTGKVMVSFTLSKTSEQLQSENMFLCYCKYNVETFIYYFRSCHNGQILFSWHFFWFDWFGL